MKPFSLSSRSLQIAALLATASAPALLLLPGCGGGSGGSSNNNPITQTNSLAGTVALGASQRGVLSVQTFSNNVASGTLTISNLPAAIAARGAQASTTAFTVGAYALSGTVNQNTGVITLTGNIPGFGAFSVSVTPPTGTTAGSFVSTFGSQTYTGTIPVPTPTASPTAGPTASSTPNPTAIPTKSPTPSPTVGGNSVPLGSGPLTLSLSSSNTSLSGGNLSNGQGALAVVDRLGTATRINLTTGNTGLPPRLFNFLIAKTGVLAQGDTLTVAGDAGGNDVVSLTVTNLNNPANSGIFRGQSGTLKIDAVSGKKVSFTIANLRMVSQNSTGSFNFAGSGSFTIQ